jgi:hypothetical protein
MSAFLDGMAKEVLKWFDTGTDEQILRVLAPNLIKLFERTKTPQERRLRILRLLQIAVTQAITSAQASEQK